MKRRITALLLALCMLLLASCVTIHQNGGGESVKTGESGAQSEKSAEGPSGSRQDHSGTPSGDTPTELTSDTPTEPTSDTPTEPTSDTPTEPTESNSESESESKYFNEDLTYDSDEEVKARIEAGFTAIDEYLARNDASEYDDLEKVFNDLMQDVNYFHDKSTLAYIDFSNDTTNEDASALYDELTQLMNGYQNRLVAYYRPAYESAFRDRFYEDWAEEDIEVALAYSDAAGEEFLAINNELDAKIKEFQELDQDDPDFMEKSQQIYYDIVHLNMQKAQKMGYDNYADYAYKCEYSRDYSPEDGRRMYGYVKDYVVPLASEIFNALVGYSQISKLIKDYNEIGGSEVDNETMFGLLAPYYDKLGGKMPEAFASFKENFTATGNSNSVPQAFTTYLTFRDHPICFFGKGYRNLMTFVHEQGHYNAFYCSECSISSFDLCEVQSQGNEWLYMAYIKDNYTASHFKYLTYYHLYDSVITIMLATACDAFEQYVYTHPELQPEDYDDVFVTQAKKMGVYQFLSSNLSIAPEDYWHYAIVDNSMYYLSYAVSKVPSIEVYVIAKTQGIDAAIEVYQKIMDVDEDAKFIETITGAGLHSPFTEEPYKAIKECF